MTFDEVLVQTVALLEQEGRMSYRALKRRFELDDDYLADLKEELIEAKRIAADEDGRFLVWAGNLPTPVVASTITRTPSHAEPDASFVPEAERRHLTVMFADLVGSTALSESLDPEELRDVVRSYQQKCADVIERYEGHIAQYLGDGLLVYFGYPVAHEDDAARAVWAGLDIGKAIQVLNAELSTPIQVRIGIHTGQVVVAEMGGGDRHEHLALGSTPNIAARVEGMAAPDTVVISADTFRLVEGLFKCEDLGQHELKGISIPKGLYRIAERSLAQSRFDVAVKHGLTALVGRESELGHLLECWSRVKIGRGQSVLLSGETGIGKSRLVQELKDHADRDGGTRIEFRCSSYHRNSALYPLIEHLQRVLKFHRTDAPLVKFEKLKLALSRYTFPQADTLPLLATLLSIPSSVTDAPLALNPKERRERTLGILRQWLFEEAQKTPLCCVWEDLHWADPTTLEFLTLCLDGLPSVRIMAVLVFRPEFVPPWSSQASMSKVVLTRLDHREVERMVGWVTARKDLPAEVTRQIVARTDGVPLFVEELTKMVLESDLVKAVNNHYELQGPVESLAIPSTLQDSLMARLDRLGPGKEVAELGATIGRTFNYELLRLVSTGPEEVLHQGLRNLIEAGLISQWGVLPHAIYLFKHAMVQETAYEVLLKSKRREYHEQIATALSTHFAEASQSHPELIARHYSEAALVAEATPYWLAAGKRATDHSAYTEAIAHLTAGLAGLDALPDTPERAEQELRLQLTLILPLQATRSHAEPEMEHACARILELCRSRIEIPADAPELFRALRGLLGFYGVRGEFRTAHELAEQLLSLAKQSKEPALLLQAHQIFGFVLYNLGELAPAREHFKKTIGLYEPEKHEPHSLGTVDDSRVVATGQLAAALWHLGYPDQALEKSYESLEYAQHLSHPFSLAVALIGVAVIHCLRRENEQAKQYAEDLVDLSQDRGFSQWLAVANICIGYTLTVEGRIERGIAQMREGVEAKTAAGARMGLPFYQALLVKGFARAGRIADGLAIVAEAMALIEKTEQRVDEPELHRLRGELLLQSINRGQKNRLEGAKNFSVAEAAECFHTAMRVARHSHEKSWELRSATSLARVWQKQGKQAEAHELLSDIYNWFTEGFDTKDLREAKALLEELA